MNQKTPKHHLPKKLANRVLADFAWIVPLTNGTPFVCSVIQVYIANDSHMFQEVHFRFSKQELVWQWTSQPSCFGVISVTGGVAVVSMAILSPTYV